MTQSATSSPGHEHLRDHSLRMTLSAIEIYNKPDFKGREQVFPILMTAAWEALLKASLLRRGSDDITTLYVRDGTSFKKNRSGQYLTIDLKEALSRHSLPGVVVRNIERLIDVRNTAIHLVELSPTLPYVVYTLGSASLRHYGRLIREWFGIGLSDYDFYILPLGFAYPFRSMSAADLATEPEAGALLLQSIAADQAAYGGNEDGFHFLCEIRTTLVSAKKITDETDLVAKLDASDEAAIIVRRDINLIEKYPYRFTDVWRRVKPAVPTAKQSDLLDLIRRTRIKDDPRYARYNFRSQFEARNGPTAATPVIYSDDFVQLAISEIHRARESDGRQ